MKTRLPTSVEVWQKLIEFDTQATRFIVTAGLVTVLVVGWLVTSPIFRLGDKMAGLMKDKARTVKAKL